MLPDNTYSTLPISNFFLSPDDKVTTALVDYERGGTALNDTTQGFNVKNWKIFLYDGKDVFVQAEEETPIFLFSALGITELALCFDQNMRPTVSWVAYDTLHLRWYDTLISNFRVDVFGAGHRNPKLSLDDKRPQNALNSDMIMAYIKNNALCYRQQRDRFEIERVLRTNILPFIRLINIGMSRSWRMQFELAG